MLPVAIAVPPLAVPAAVTIMEPVAVLPSSRIISSCLANFPAMASEQIMYDPVKPIIAVLAALVTPIVPPTAFLGR
jgi:hypothetical protein